MNSNGGQTCTKLHQYILIIGHKERIDAPNSDDHQQASVLLGWRRRFAATMPRWRKGARKAKVENARGRQRTQKGRYHKSRHAKRTKGAVPGGPKQGARALREAAARERAEQLEQAQHAKQERVAKVLEELGQLLDASSAESLPTLYEQRLLALAEVEQAAHEFEACSAAGAASVASAKAWQMYYNARAAELAAHDREKKVEADAAVAVQHAERRAAAAQDAAAQAHAERDAAQDVVVVVVTV